MVAPNDFENLQTVYLRVYNKIVRENFREDIADDDFSTPESQMRYACLVKDNDTAQMMQLRSNLFFMIREEAKAMQPEIYGIPVADYQETVKFRPQVQLHFTELAELAAKHDRQHKRMRVSWRLMSESSTTLKETTVDALRSRIKRLFPRTYHFKTGKLKLSYRDREAGREWQIPAYTEAEGKRFIERLTEADGAGSPNWKLLTVSQYTDKNFSEKKTISILGERHKLPQQRRVTEVYLKKAELKIHGNLTDVALYETW